MYSQIYFVPKRSGTLTDSLLAFGTARVLSLFVRQFDASAQTKLRDDGMCYLIDVGVPVQEGWLSQATPFDPAPFLTSSKVALPDDLPRLRTRDVDEQWDRFRQYQERAKQLREKKIDAEELQQALQDVKPESDWTVVTYLGDYRMQAQAIHNQLVEQWRRSNDHFFELNLRTLLALFASPTANWDEIAGSWKQATKTTAFKDAFTASQLFNPHMGKGQNRTKANGLTMGNEKSFWLLEFLKVVGVWLSVVPTRATNADLRKTYSVAPIELGLEFHNRMYADFRERLWNDGAVKQDIMAALLYTEVLLEQSVENDLLALFKDGPVSSVVSGMNVATYQLLSQNSYTMMNLSFLGLPDWMPHILSSQDAEEFIEILREHRQRIRAIDESKSEGYALLQLYRDFISGNYLEPFFDFCAGYSSYLSSALDRSQYYVKPFSETNLRRLIEMMKPALSTILDNEGFRNIARAIRSSTVIPLYIGRSQSRFDIRYGLGQELKRKSRYNDQFIQALSDFMQSYNDETMRVHERTKGAHRRKLITIQDIEDVVGLIDQFDAATVGNLLVAVGYARDAKSEPQEMPGVSDEQELLETLE